MNVKPVMDQFQVTRTTITLPTSLIERTQALVERGLIPNRTAAITIGLEAFLDEVERQEIDRAFEGMADDESYRDLNIALTESFAVSDWEALRLAESGG